MNGSMEYTSAPPVCLHGAHKDNFTFGITYIYFALLSYSRLPLWTPITSAFILRILATADHLGDLGTWIPVTDLRSRRLLLTQASCLHILRTCQVHLTRNNDR